MSVLLRTTGATSDITLNNTITASASGNAITLASGRNFINNAGSGALSAPSGRWLVYSTNSANDTTGSLTNSFRRFSCAYSGSCPTLGSGNGFLYSYTPTLTATPDAVSVNAGAAVPDLSGYAYTLSGYLGSDASSDVVTGSLNGSTNYTLSSAIGDYAITYVSGSLASTLGYGFSYADNASGVVADQSAVSTVFKGGDTARIFFRQRYEPPVIPGQEYGSNTQQPVMAPASPDDSPNSLTPAANGQQQRQPRPYPLIDISPELQDEYGLPAYL
jgi:hypothetical protein